MRMLPIISPIKNLSHPFLPSFLPPCLTQIVGQAQHASPLEQWSESSVGSWSRVTVCTKGLTSDGANQGMRLLEFAARDAGERLIQLVVLLPTSDIHEGEIFFFAQQHSLRERECVVYWYPFRNPQQLHNYALAGREASLLCIELHLLSIELHLHLHLLHLHLPDLAGVGAPASARWNAHARAHVWRDQVVGHAHLDIGERLPLARACRHT